MQREIRKKELRANKSCDNEISPAKLQTSQISWIEIQRGKTLPTCAKPKNPQVNTRVHGHAAWLLHVMGRRISSTGRDDGHDAWFDSHEGTLADTEPHVPVDGQRPSNC